MSSTYTIGPGTLKVTVLYGRGLASKDSNGKSDPFCVFGFWQSEDKPMSGLVHKTKYKKATLNPVWSDKDRSEITFTLKEPIDVNFKLKVWDYDHVGSPDYLGEVEVSLLKIIENKVYKFTDPLQKKVGYKGTVTGSVAFVWEYVPTEEVKKLEDNIIAQLTAERNAQVQDNTEESEKTEKTTKKHKTKSEQKKPTETTTTTTTDKSDQKTSEPVHVTLNLSGTADSPTLAKLRHSALLGDAKTAFELGKAYALGSPELGVEANDEEALKYYLIAAEDGMAIAQFKVGLFNQMGYGCQINYGRAFVWYERAVGQNQGDALTAIAEMYESGWGVEKNIKRSLEYHHRAYDFGEKDSLPHLGRIYRSNGEYDKALEYLRLAVEHDEDDSDSFYLLGEIYEKGLGVEQNIETAISFYNKAIQHEHDHKQSLLALIKIYLSKGNHEKALECLQSAVEQDEKDSDSLYLLGELYEKGHGVQQNNQTAINYYKKAIQHSEDHKQSQEALKRLGID